MENNIEYKSSKRNYIEPFGRADTIYLHTRKSLANSTSPCP